MAGTVERTLALKLIADVGDVGKGMKVADKGMARVEKRADKLKGSLRSVGSGLASWGKAFSGALVIGGIEKVTDAIGDAWEGFRSGQKVAAQLGVTWRNLGLESSSLAGTLDKVTAAATRLGMSDDDAVDAFNTSIKRTKDSRASYRELQIAMDLVANGAAPNLTGAMRLIEQAGKGSSRVVDRFGLKSKTSGGRIRELGNQVKGAAKKAAALDPFGVLVNQINEDLEGIVGSFATGNIEGGIDAIAAAGEHLGEAWGKLGTSLPKPITDFVDTYGPKVATQFEAAADAVSALGSAFSAIAPVFEPVLNLLGSALASTIDTGTNALKGMASLLRGDFGGAWRSVTKIVLNAVIGMINAWNSLDFRVPPFDFSWGGGEVFGGTPLAFQIPGGSFRFWEGTGDLFPDVNRQTGTSGAAANGGAFRQSKGAKVRGNNIGGPSTRLPGHEAGLDRVPRDDYMARLHKDEAVLNADAADAWRGGMGGGTTVNNYVTVSAPVGSSPTDIGRTIQRYLDEYGKRRGGS